MNTGNVVFRPEGAATNQPRATPWGPVACRDPSPERARHPWPCAALSGLEFGLASWSQGDALVVYTSRNSFWFNWLR